jgi:hypothetical protein
MSLWVPSTAQLIEEVRALVFERNLEESDRDEVGWAIDRVAQSHDLSARATKSLRESYAEAYWPQPDDELEQEKLLANHGGDTP